MKIQKIKKKFLLIKKKKKNYFQIKAIIKVLNYQKKNRIIHTKKENQLIKENQFLKIKIKYQ